MLPAAAQQLRHTCSALQDDARYFLVTGTEGQLVAFTHFRCARLLASAGLCARLRHAAVAPSRLPCRQCCASSSTCPCCLPCSCRFEVEENELVADEMERLRLERYDPVIYCYELQLHPSVHRKGLGKRLMQMLELVVRQWRTLSCGLLKQEGLAAAAAGSSLTTCLIQLCTRWRLVVCRNLLCLLPRRLSNSACTW